jgi:hypothetical protein
MAVINLLETINTHMKKRLALFEIDKFDVELVYQIISASKEHIRDDIHAKKEDIEALKKDVIQFVSNDSNHSNHSVEEGEMRVAKLTKHIIAAIHRLVHVDHIEMSRINVFAASSCKNDEEDVEIVADEVVDEEDDIFEREVGGVISKDNKNLYEEDEDIQNVVFGDRVDDRAIHEVDQEEEDGLNDDSLPQKHKSGIISNIFKDLAAKKKTVNDIAGGDESDDESDDEGYDFDEVFDDDEL